MKAIPLTPALERRTQPPAAPARVRAALVGALGLVREWRRRARSRTELAALDDRTLRDIGLSRADVWAELDKPFWSK
jgi:uncharacterized protein YjiS (DUF1127 family)